MARAVSVVVTGSSLLDRKLRGMDSKLQAKLSRQATRKAAREIVLPAAKERVPVDTGELEDSLEVRAMKRSRKRIGHRVGTKDGDYRGDQFYGAFIEFGTKERQHASGKSVGRIDPAKNFAYLRPALYDNEAAIRKLYLTTIKQLIRELKK